VRRILRGIGIFFLICAATLVALAIAAWPPEGLFFGLPFLFLIPALFCGIVGGLLLLFTRGPRGLPPTQEGGGCR
jgi:hypothetical protein